MIKRLSRNPRTASFWKKGAMALTMALAGVAAQPAAAGIVTATIRFDELAVGTSVGTTPLTVRGYFTENSINYYAEFRYTAINGSVIPQTIISANGGRAVACSDLTNTILNDCAAQLTLTANVASQTWTGLPVKMNIKSVDVANLGTEPTNLGAGVLYYNPFDPNDPGNSFGYRIGVAATDSSAGQSWAQLPSSFTTMTLPGQPSEFDPGGALPVSGVEVLFTNIVSGEGANYALDNIVVQFESGSVVPIIVQNNTGGGGNNNVPEPATLALLGLALLGAGFTRRKRSA